MKWFILLASYWVVGCASMTGYPDKITDTDTVLAAIQIRTGQEQISKCIMHQTKFCRDDIIYATMLGVDTNFAKFEQTLFNQDREISFLSNAVTIGLNAANIFYGTQILSILSTTVIGAQSAFDSKAVVNNNLASIHNQMRVYRNQAKIKLMLGLKQPIRDYPIQQANLDLVEYYNAGTLLMAVVGLAESSGVKASETGKALAQVTINEPK